jgi:arginase
LTDRNDEQEGGRGVRGTVGIIGAPSSAGAVAPGQEKAPQALRDAGLVERLRQAGLDVVDHGDLPRHRWRPDRDHPRAQNAEAVVANALQVAVSVRRVRSDGQVALVLGGDCTVGLGTVAGVLPADESLGLIYFDLHADLNVPSSVEAGNLDWMGVAHLLGEEGVVPALGDLGPRAPLLANDQVLLFGHDPAHATPRELEAIERRSLRSIPVGAIVQDPDRASAEAVQLSERAWTQVLVHLDVDVIDFTDAPLSENPGRNTGLSLADAFVALRALLGSSRLVALTVTELNPDHGEEDGSTIDRFVDGLVDCLADA